MGDGFGDAYRSMQESSSLHKTWGENAEDNPKLKAEFDKVDEELEEYEKESKAKLRELREKWHIAYDKIQTAHNN